MRLKKERKDKPVRVFLPASLDDELRAYSRASGVPLAEIVRTAISSFLSSDREWQAIRRGHSKGKTL
jgi:hypothetical protein